MGKGKKSILRFDFGRNLDVEFYGAKVTVMQIYWSLREIKKIVRCAI